MRQIFLMFTLMLIVMLAVHFKKVVRVNAIDSAAMVQAQTMFYDQSPTVQRIDAARETAAADADH